MHSLLNSALLIQFMISICILGRKILMRQTKRRMILAAAVVFAWVGLSQIVLETYVDARAGGGGSGVFRGSRPYQAPSRRAQPTPVQQKRDTPPPPQQPGPVTPQL